MRAPAIRVGLEPDELIIDSFAGGGGASMGMEMTFGRSPDIAINHDAEAIALHRENHPGTRHFCEDVWAVDPVKACGGRRVGLFWLSPDCKHFSKAKGGKPVEKKIRGLAWIACRWAKALGPNKPRVIVLENVEEFADWGPLTDDNMPCRIRKGMTFRRFVKQLSNLGYTVDWQVMRASDYGAPTIRKRLFLVARCDGQPITWPEKTHGPGLLPYRTAAECIDWSVPCPSIFERKKPLAENTQRRIARGMFRYVINCADPFIVPTTHQGDARTHGIDEPLRTVTGAQRGEMALVTPYLARTAHGERDKNGKKRGRGEHSIAEPLPTVTASPDFSVVAPYLARIGQTGGNGKYANDARDPLTTITSKNEHLLVSPTLIQMGYGEAPGQQPRVPGIDKPLGTVVAGGGKFALVSAFLAKHYGDQWAGKKAAGADEPLPTITGRGTQLNLVTSNLIKLRGTCRDGQPVDQPMPTVTGGGTHIAEVRAFLTKYYGTDQDPRLTEPLHTIRTKDCFGLVTVLGTTYQIADIGMRMLLPRELFTAQGFPTTYRIDFAGGKPVTKTAQIRMCGNSVSPPNAAAILIAQFCQQLTVENVA
jgi:DNA (cytosine-5)-methyltransferase 1